MFAGALAYVWFYPAIERALESVPDWGKVTLPELTLTSPWLWIVGLGVAWIASVYVFKSRHPRVAAKQLRH